MQLSATIDDTRYTANNGTEPTQNVAVAEYFVDVPPWDAGAVSLTMNAADGTFDEQVEAVEATVDTTGLAAGRHTLFVRGSDVNLNGVFCDGAETCDPVLGCPAGSDPCPGETCDFAVTGASGFDEDVVEFSG